MSYDVKMQITFDKVKSSIFHDFYQYLKSQQLDATFLESNFNIKQYIKKSIDQRIKNYCRINKLNYYKKEQYIASGSFGSVYSVST